MSQPAAVDEFDVDLHKQISQSLDACDQCFREMNERLRPLEKYTEQDLRRRIPDSVRYLFARSEIERQGQIVDQLARDMSLLFQMLTARDIEAERERQQEVNEYVRNLMELYKKDAVSDSEIPHAVSEPSEDIANGSQEVEPASTEIGDVANQTSEDVEEFDMSAMPDDPASLLRPTENPVITAVKSKDIEVVRNLVRTADASSLYKADVEQWTVLHHAVRIKSPEVLSVLLGSGFDEESGFIDKFSNQGHAALMAAARCSDSPEAQEMAKLLIILGGCQVDVPDTEGRTALYFAIQDPPSNESEAFAKLLVDNGANVLLVHERLPKQVEKYACLNHKVREQQANAQNNGGGLRAKISRTFSTSKVEK